MVDVDVLKWLKWLRNARNSMNTGLFPLKYLLLCKRSPAQNLWSQEKEIRLESTHLSSEHHSDNQVLDFPLPRPRPTTVVEICFGMEAGWGRVLYFTLISASLFHSLGTETIPGPFLNDQVLEVHFGVKLKQRHGQMPLEISPPLLSFCSRFSGLLQISQTGFYLFTSILSTFTQLCVVLKTQKCSQNKKWLLLFPFTLLRVPHESLCVFLSHPSRFLIVKPGFSAGFHKHIWVTQVGFFFKWKQAR